MNAQEFVDAIRFHSIREGAESALSLLETPPGRGPSAELIALSNWFHGLGESDKECVAQVARIAAHHAAFGALAILDGSRRVEVREGGGYFELRHVAGDVTEVLSGPGGAALHELL